MTGERGCCQQTVGYGGYRDRARVYSVRFNHGARHAADIMGMYVSGVSVWMLGVRVEGALCGKTW